MYEIKMKLPFFIALILFSAGVYADPALPADSVYQITTKWIDSAGESAPLEKLRGTPVIMTMVYLTCQHSCPMTISKLKNIEDNLKANGVENYKFVLVSFDFKKDRPEALKKYMTGKNLDPSHWVMLTGSNDQEVRELSIVLGINYKMLGDGDYSHSNVLALLDKEGRILSKVDRLSADDNALVKAMTKIMRNK
jgi:protein SCO1/2